MTYAVLCGPCWREVQGTQDIQLSPRGPGRESLLLEEEKSKEGVLPQFTSLYTEAVSKKGCGSVGDVGVQVLPGAWEQ